MARADETTPVEFRRDRRRCVSFHRRYHRAPDLTAWAHSELIPVMQSGFRNCPECSRATATMRRRLQHRVPGQIQGCGCDGGNRTCATRRGIARNSKGEANRSIVHELVHVAQQYVARARRAGSSRASRTTFGGISTSRSRRVARFRRSVPPPRAMTAVTVSRQISKAPHRVASAARR